MGAVSALVLGGCGGGDDDDRPGPAVGPDPGELTLVQFFGNDVLRAGIEQRATFGLGDVDGVVVTDAPETLELRLTRNGDSVLDPVELIRHQEGLPRPYYPLVFTPDEPGVYEAVAVSGGRSTPPRAFQILAPDQVSVPQVGDAMPALATPTVDDARGVDPICTDEPACPLHDVTLADALAAGRPVALLVATPKYCQVAICGPVLDILRAAQADHPDVKMLHAEVWTDGSLETTTPTVRGLSLTFEPCLFLVGSDGGIRQRLDTVYDGAELRSALATLT